jgi:hypothetical protein
MYEHAYEHLDFPMVAGNIYGSRTAINQPLTGIGQGKKDA